MDITAALCNQPEFDADMFSSVVSKPTSKSLFQSLGDPDPEPNVVLVDHCYAKPWNAHPDSCHARPAKMLFMKGIIFNSSLDMAGYDQEIDVTSESPSFTPIYDISKASATMRECERYSRSNANAHGSDDWEEKISRQGWATPKKRLFNKVAKILNNDCLARLVYKNHPNEPVMRRLALDKTTARMRHLFASISWDMTLLHWLHLLLTENLPKPHLAVYLDILQTLKSKLPVLVDKMLQCAKNNDSLAQLLRRTWDPVVATLNQNKLKKLSGTPLIVWTPGDPAYSCVGQSKRMKLWHSQLSALGKLVTVNPQVNQGVTIAESLDAIITAVRYEVMELKLNFPSRPIILIGWTIGALIACQVALVEPVTAIVCLGFPLTGVNGSRGDLDDPLLENLTPTLFVVGQKATMCSVDDIEDFRERMRAESGLVVIGGADDHLRVCSFKKRLEGISQIMVDRCILEEVSDFLNHVLNQPPSNPVEPSNLSDKRRRRITKDCESDKKKISKNGSLPVSSVPSRTVSPSSPVSSSTETSSSGSSITDMIDKSTRPRQQLKHSCPPADLNLPKRLRTASEPPSSSGQFFSQQLGLPAITPAMSSPRPVNPNSSVRPQPGFSKEISPLGFNPNIGSLPSTGPFKQSPIAVTSSTSKSQLVLPVRCMTPKSSDTLSHQVAVKKLVMPPLSFKSGTPTLKPAVTRPSSVSYLTVANPMLSSILDGNTQSFLNSKSTGPFSTSQSDTQSPKRCVSSEGLKTYMRSPNQSFNKSPKTGAPNVQMLSSSLVKTVNSGHMQLPSSEKKAYIISGNPSSQNNSTSLLQSTLQAAQPSARKMQVITFLKPQTLVPKPIIIQPTTNSPSNNSSTSLASLSSGSAHLVKPYDSSRVIFTSAATGTVKSKPVSSLSFASVTDKITPDDTITKAVNSQSSSSHQLMNEVPSKIINDEKTQYALSQQSVIDPMPKMSPFDILSQQVSGEKSELRKLVEPDQLDMSELTAFTCALTSPVCSYVTSNEISDQPTINLGTELKSDNVESITDRLSHLSAGTQEAILALTQLSSYSQVT